ncbi:MAG: DUF87 domain-containing protein [Spirochaetes bacterium]|nr:DUF87 domain-containing protein [Spirochaetota bacterium]
MKQFLEKASYQENPLRYVYDFMENEKRIESAEQYDDMRFVGYVMDIGYDSARIITSDPYKRAVGGIPKGSFLIMVPESLDNLAPHFSLLRVEDVAPTPLTPQVQQTYFELHKKSMPNLDVWTQQELQWGALNTKVLGMFYPDPADSSKLSFSGDVNTIVSAHRYRIFAPDKKLLELIVNGIVRTERQVEIGMLRMTECRLPFAGFTAYEVPVKISVRDFQGFRTAMFGKTRLGKSNVVKLIAQAAIEATQDHRNIGQLIFDINGEYANDNPQDGNKSIRSKHASRCKVYALNPREGADYAKQLMLNFYEQPESCIEVLASLLALDKRNSIYIKSFSSVKLPTIQEILTLPAGEKTRPIRKIQLYWAILRAAGFDADEKRLRELGLRGPHTHDFDPHFNDTLRNAAYSNNSGGVPPAPNSLSQLVQELIAIDNYRKTNLNNALLFSKSSGDPIFDSDDIALLGFLNPDSGAGPAVLRAFLKYHSSQAGDFIKEIIDSLDSGETVILDLGNATDEIRRYFSDMLSKAVFSRQEEKFVSNQLSDNFVQLYFEEAHNLFPRDNKDLTDVYSRFAKEGAKFHIGMVYSTQSPSTISQELLAQTENFFVGHLSSQDEVNALSRVQIAYEGIGEEIMKSKTPGYMRMLTFSHRFVVPVQAFKFE